MEISENKDDKEDNSYAKGVEEEKGDTLMKFKTGKISDNNKEEVYNNIDPNNSENKNNYQESNLKTENKIKLNQDFLKQSKLNTDNKLISQNKGDNNKDNKTAEDIEGENNLGEIQSKLLTKINRCFSDKTIMIITIIMLLFSILLFLFSVFDLIKMKIKNNKNYFMNSLLFQVFEVINITSILIYHMMNYYLKPKLSHNIILLLIFLLVIVAFVRCLNFAKKKDNMFSIIVYLCQNFLTNVINGLTLYFFFIDSKKRKSAMHGIEEIINFTELNANFKSKKEDGLQLDIMPSNKEKPIALVEEEENK